MKTLVKQDSLSGTGADNLWLQGSTGYGNEQVLPDFQISIPLTITSDGKFNGKSANT
jgi:hypothetical protein